MDTVCKRGTYGPRGAGNALFSVSAFMDTLAPTDKNADELMAAGAAT